MVCTNLIFRNCSCPPGPSCGKTGKFSVCPCHLHYYIPQQLPPVSILLPHSGADRCAPSLTSNTSSSVMPHKDTALFLGQQGDLPKSDNDA